MPAFCLFMLSASRQSVDRRCGVVVDVEVVFHQVVELMPWRWAVGWERAL